ncbi:hypothetical protein Mgra_00002188 [Meloidogyne graminicola]|uniref:Neuroendocrine convertase 2 n=1 Tax=Meloidogyne graminicola TaxID=189291 RepID=A0A8S9ZZ16_9BILA|nr:hypothetical protein Mgra_00002188 [Meloidogyne graminicola]
MSTQLPSFNIKIGGGNNRIINTLITKMIVILLLIITLINDYTLGIEVFTNHFLVHLNEPGIQNAHKVAKRNGFINRGSVINFNLNLNLFLKKVLGSDSEWHFIQPALSHARTRRSIGHHAKLAKDPHIKYVEQMTGYKRLKRGYRPLADTLQEQLDFTAAIMDDGVDYMHPDLRLNFNAEASYDFSSNDPYPYPRYTDDWFNSHGTRCAGEIAAARDNGVCGVGVAYDSKVAGIRMLDQPYMTDLIEANSMGHEPNKIHIYSASWGPTDDGKTVDGPRNATMRSCSSTLASTFSNGGRNPESGVATTDLYGRCTRSHSGTSAAAPEAAGVFALALEANPNLTWRDLQHLTVLTSSRNSLFDGRCRELPPLNLKGVTKQLYKGLSNCSHFEWQMNGVGLEYNHLFGYGVLDAAEIVLMAKVWKTMPPRFHCEAGTIEHPTRIPSTGDLLLELNTDACIGSSTEVNYLEHVQAIVSLNSSRRGDTTLYLISPMGTPSMILSRRPKDDDSKDGFTNWPFMTTHTWGENPKGKWRLLVRFQSGKSTPIEQQKHHVGWLKKFTLMLHGTKDPPYVGIEGRRCYSCSGQCLAGAPCNCQMGSCESDFCFSEKQPSEIPGIFRLSKGCVKRPSRTRAGCDFDHFSDHILCVCGGPGDFCNDNIFMHVNTANWKNITCRHCQDGRPDCGQTCQGQWCHQKISTGAAGCGFGPPSLPYLYKTTELLQRQQHVCLSISRGGGISSQSFCICGGKNMCNLNGDNTKSDSSFISSLLKSFGGVREQQQQQRNQWEISLTNQKQQLPPPSYPLYDCINCDMSTEDISSSMTSNCRQNKCKGQFCVYAAQRIFSNNWSSNRNGNNGQQQNSQNTAKMNEKRGCINITAPTSFVQFGCTHKWVQNELEEIYCACKGNLCNFDLATASESSAPKQLFSSLFRLYIYIFLILFFL